MASNCEKCGSTHWSYSDKILTDGKLWCLNCTLEGILKLSETMDICPYCHKKEHDQDCQIVKILNHFEWQLVKQKGKHDKQDTVQNI